MTNVVQVEALANRVAQQVGPDGRAFKTNALFSNAWICPQVKIGSYKRKKT
jgi:hypothetical protein